MDISAIMISLSAPIIGYAGSTITLMCSTVIISDPPAQDVIFEWFFGSDSNSSLPSGVTASDTTNINSSYTSTLEFSPLLLIHAGLYTCQFGGNQKLERNTTVSVDNCESSDRVG